MRAVNLVPRDARRAGVGGGSAFTGGGPAYVVLAVLAIAVALGTIAVLTNNTIASRKAKLASLRVQLTAEQALAARLTGYERFEQLAQARAQTVRQIVSGRFDWHAALTDLSKVVPANTTLQTLNATVSSSGSGSGGAAGLRNAINAPAFDITGCSRTQDDVARVISRLRAMNGVTRVTLQDSSKESAVQAAASVSAKAATCDNGPTFHLVVFFQPLASGAAQTSTTGGQSVSTVPPSKGGVP